VLRKIYITSIFLIGAFLSASFASAQSVSISFYPEVVSQGEPLMIQINASSTKIKKLTFGGVPVRIFNYKNKATGLVGIDLNKTPGEYYVIAETYNGVFAVDKVIIKHRKRKELPYNIPEKLGGNTFESQRNLVRTLAEENNDFKGLKTGNKTWWISGFIPPLVNPVVGDEFGYYRRIGSLVMPHKGVDYDAPIGTKVISTNDGIVRAVSDSRNYGKYVVIDHGLGVFSFYLHLSETIAKKGTFVYKGDIIGLSGETGYADEPHLHFSIRIYGVTVDPIKFLELFK
jgi:murein DD-endopeptidase MepM/ murein hydrolase activator NlpD